MVTDTIEREAKLFEAGSYPDRGIEITEEDLDVIVANTAEAPVRIEHTATPFDGALGVLRSVYRKGKELFGRLAFTRAAWELIQAANARRLSVAIRKDKSAIAEVSLVREPRIADAAVFGETESVRLEEVEFALDLSPAPSDAEGETAHSSPATEELTELRRQLAERDADAAVEEFKRAGKIVPASEAIAHALLRCGDDMVVTFGDRPTPISRLFRCFLDSQPRVIEFAELATVGGGPEEPEVFTKLGVTSAQVERYRDR